MSRSPREVMSLSNLEESIRTARREKRWVDASEDLERWLALSRQMSTMETAEVPTLAPRAGVGKFFAAKQVRRSSFTDEEEKLRLLLPKVQKAIEKHNHSTSERVMFLAYVNKHNAHGKVQARLLAVTGAALYNLDHGGTKLKRRITLASVGSVSSNELSGQFVLHVPSEYDYHFSAPTRGYDTAEMPDSPNTSRFTELANRPPVASMIDALQRAYATSMGGTADSPNLLAVRNITSESDLSRHVQKKGQATTGESARWSSINGAGTALQTMDDDDDD